MPIFESPDRGKTIYKREIGSRDRVLIREDTPNVLLNREQDLWYEIHRAAKTNNALQEALDRVKIIYYLSKDNGNSKT